MRQLVQQDGSTSSEGGNERQRVHNMVSVQSESEKSQDLQAGVVEKLREKVAEQELQIKQMSAILKVTGNENLVSGQQSTLGGQSDGTNKNILVSDTL